MATLKQLVDETTNIKNDIVTCHTNLKNNLIDKGVECSEADKMQTLVDKVKEIEVGHKIATGAYSSEVVISSTGYSKVRINTSLSFVPSQIILNTGNYRRYSTGGTVASTGDLTNNVLVDSSVSKDSFATTKIATSGIITDFYITNITESGFDFYYKINIASYYVKLTNMKWYAIS